MNYTMDPVPSRLLDETSENGPWVHSPPIPFSPEHYVRKLANKGQCPPYKMFTQGLPGLGSKILELYVPFPMARPGSKFQGPLFPRGRIHHIEHSISKGASPWDNQGPIGIHAMETHHGQVPIKPNLSPMTFGNIHPSLDRDQTIRSTEPVKNFKGHGIHGLEQGRRKQPQSCAIGLLRPLA